MRLGILATYPPTRCGIGRYTSFLVKALRENYPSLRMVILTDQEVGYQSSPGLTVIPCFRAGSFVAREVEDRLRDLRLDLLHVQHHYGIFGFAEDFLNLLRLCPTVVTLHEVHTAEFPEKIALTYEVKDLQRNHYLLGSYASKVIVHSEAMKNALLEFGVEEDKIAVIPHGTLILPSLDRATALEAYDLPPEARVILSFGFVRGDKNEKLLIQAFPRILEEVPEAWLVMAGSVHPLSEKQDRLVADERREITRRFEIRNVRFIEEFIPDERLPLIFSLADLFISLYDQRYREISGALHLGIGAGVPCVVTRVPRYEEIERISPETTVEVGNEEELVRVIVRLLKDEGLRARVAQAIRSYREETSWERIASLHYQLYREVVASSKALCN